ncbi:MAG: ribonuclease P protein component [Pseudomonadales bacterium]
MATHEFPRTRRLTNAREYDAVFKQADYRASVREFLLLAKKTDGQISRIGSVVSKKVAGNAIQRNRIRRLIKESFRTEFDKRFGYMGLDIVIVARPPVRYQPNRETLDVLAGLWEQLAKKRQAQQ